MSKPSIIISGHGTFAAGIKGALDMLASVPDKWYFVNFENGMSDEQLGDQFQQVQKKIGAQQEIVYFTDLAGGTPYKTAAELAFQEPQVEVVAGCNVGSLLEVLYFEADSAAELAAKLVSSAANGINRFELDDSPKSQKDSDDGI
ncbi:PTS sugar transporter subunit IIA [Ligilactobacillus salitolerans]|uniref:PTS sugar transporter subunit IIA n=1 Tax=Ligilactobacillus salitolerans TaxID=1808352 RepID=A0A401IQ99_9LACO|nr:PTS sugar transporter [Ligilactobacillus salitolerans]GBG93693.1 PTS sugar transporter subunit IIA [Ligilactobacillus salitolerans]